MLLEPPVVVHEEVVVQLVALLELAVGQVVELVVRVAAVLAVGVHFEQVVAPVGPVLQFVCLEAFAQAVVLLAQLLYIFELPAQ